MRKICVITGSRAEYGLLYWLMKEIRDDAGLELQLVVTGMHLSPEFGQTWRQIEADGFGITKKVEMLLSADTPTAISKAIGLGVIGFADAFAELSPDLLVVLGDRFEIMAAVLAALQARIPVAHCHGGELTQGAVDDAMRHAITKMSHLHFTATEAYRKRVIQLGEAPQRVFNVGALGIENIKRLTLLNKTQLAEQYGFVFGEKNILIIFHPVTLEDSTAKQQFTALLQALDILDNVRLFFSKPNADAGGRIIGQLIDNYVAQHPDKAMAFISLGSLKYLSLLRYMDVVVGNSSSGLLEAPSFQVATLNIGDRQKGRVKAASVVDCSPTRSAIEQGLQTVFSAAFQSRLKIVTNPYDQGNSAANIKQIIKSYPLDELVKKHFRDL